MLLLNFSTCWNWTCFVYQFFYFKFCINLWSVQFFIFFVAVNSKGALHQLVHLQVQEGSNEDREKVTRTWVFNSSNLVKKKGKWNRSYLVLYDFTCTLTFARHGISQRRLIKSKPKIKLYVYLSNNHTTPW